MLYSLLSTRPMAVRGCRLSYPQAPMHSKVPVLEAAIAMKMITTVAATRTTGPICVSGPIPNALSQLPHSIQTLDDHRINIDPVRLRRSGSNCCIGDELSLQAWLTGIQVKLCCGSVACEFLDSLQISSRVTAFIFVTI